MSTAARPSSYATSTTAAAASVAASAPPLTPEQRAEIREAFDLFDVTAQGSIDTKELKMAMRALGIDVTREEMDTILHDVSTGALHPLFKWLLNKSLQVERDASGHITFDTFASIIARKFANRDQTSELSRAFKLFDDDNTGKITFRKLRRVARELGETLTDEEIQEMIDEADRNGDGQVDEEVDCFGLLDRVEVTNRADCIQRSLFASCARRPSFSQVPPTQRKSAYCAFSRNRTSQTLGIS